MELQNFQHLIKMLATFEESNSEIISCYLRIHHGSFDRAFFLERMRLIRAGLEWEERAPFEEAWGKIETYLSSELKPSSEGVVLFSRSGELPFFLALQFRVPLPNWISAGAVPHIYHLVELKDNYHRYVVLLTTEQYARILTVTLGAITEQVWKEKPALRERVGHEWTKNHYRNHRRERMESFVREKVRMLDQLMTAGGHTHLVLAGNPNMTARVKRELPKHLLHKLVDMVDVSGDDSKVVAETLRAFLKKEEQESQEMADLLIQEVNMQGLAVVGTAQSYRALERGQADALVMATDYRPDSALVCPMCSMVTVEHAVSCPRCLHSDMKRINVKEEMVRMAEQNNCKVEIVQESPVLMEYGGVGCLLRYAQPEAFFVPSPASAASAESQAKEQ